MADTSPLFPKSSRYRVHAAIASGGMATVYVGALHGPNGFERRVAIKRAHAHLLRDPTTRRMLVEEARLASRMNHPNVVGVRDVEENAGELFLIMDYVEGASLSRLLVQAPMPGRVAGRIVLDAAIGLAAVHALSETGEERLEIVHRDVSPANILVGVDGTARLSDFGIAKNALSIPWQPNTAIHARRGKPAYMAPEYLTTGVATPKLDVFALGIVAWESFTGQRLFRAGTDAETTERVLAGPIPRPSEIATELTPGIDGAIMRALERDPAKRSTAHELASQLESALQAAGLLGTRREVELLVTARFGASIRARRKKIREASTTAPPSDEIVASETPFERPARSKPRFGAIEALTLMMLGAAAIVYATEPITPPHSALATPRESLKPNR